MSFYSNLNKTAANLLAKYRQGVVEVGRPVSVDGPFEWSPPTITTQWTRINAAVSGVSQKYVDGVNIVISDRQILTQIPVPFNETAGDQVRIDGKVVAVLAIVDLPGAGLTVATRLIVRR